MLTRAELKAEDFVLKAAERIEEMPGRLSSLRELTKAEMNRVITLLFKAAGSPRAAAPEAALFAGADPDLSFAAETKDGAAGLLLGEKRRCLYDQGISLYSPKMQVFLQKHTPKETTPA